MAKKILISIKPEFVSSIISGTKKYEYRRIAAKQDISSIIIYETTPTKMIVAEAEVLDVLKMEKEELWEQTKEFSGITKDFFLEYFKDKNIGYAYKLGQIKKYESPICLADYGVKHAPESFMYIYEK